MRTHCGKCEDCEYCNICPDIDYRIDNLEDWTYWNLGGTGKALALAALLTGDLTDKQRETTKGYLRLLILRELKGLKAKFEGDE